MSRTRRFPAPISSPPSLSAGFDIRFMREALALAEKGRGWVAPNPLVGCVIVKDDRIIGRGYHRRYGACHAEVAALTEAGERARGATMYVTLQPCNHFGKTPPCTEAVIRAGIRRLVIAARDPNLKTKCEDGRQKLVTAGIEIATGIGETEALKQNEVYVHNLRHRRPFVVLKLAATLDAKIADFAGRSRWITSEASLDYVHRLRGEYAAILVGAGTVRKDNPSLTCRAPGMRNPLRVVLDPRLTVPASSRVFMPPGAVLLFHGSQAPPKSRRQFRSQDISIREIGLDRDGLLAWPEILDRLFQTGIASVLIEGGAKVAASALSAGIVNKLYLFLAPRILGQGISFSNELGPRPLSKAIAMKDWRSLRVGNDLLIEGYF